MSDAPRNYDLTAKSEGERLCYEHILKATGLENGQNAFLGSAPPILNCMVALFGGKAHTDSPPGGLLEKAVFRLRFIEYATINDLVGKILDCLPLETDGRVIYFGPRNKFCPDPPEIVQVNFDVAGQTVPGFAADVELVAAINLMQISGATP